MNPVLSTRGRSVRGIVLASLVALAGLSAVAQAGPRSSEDRQPGGDVVRVRRGGSGQSGASTVGVTRGAPARVESQPVQDDGGESAASSTGGPEAAPDAMPDVLPDLDPIAAGLPDATAGEAPDAPTPSEVIMFTDIGVRGERNGRIVKLSGAEVVFADCAVQVQGGTPLGYTGVMGSANANPGSVPAVRFTLESGGTVTLTIQPAPANRTAPSRPVRTITMIVP
jgi:hypothetical protein